MLLCLLLSFAGKGMANVVLDPVTKAPISADSILNNVMTFAPFYESVVSDYKADLYIKGMIDIKKKNFILRYVPSMFKMQKGVRKYIIETYSDLHFTAPGIYDQKVKAAVGTLHGNKGVPGLLEYFNINLYSSSLLDERLLSPLAKNGRKYYKYLIDSIMGTPDERSYKIRFIPRTKSDQLVGGFMVVSDDVWSVREIRFSGRSELLLFSCRIEMGQVGEENEFLPVSYDVDASFNFLGNRMNGNYSASLNYREITLEEKSKLRKRKRKKIPGQSKYDLSESFNLQCDTNAYNVDTAYFETLRATELSEEERQVYRDDALRRDTVHRNMKPKTKSQVFWGQVGDIMVSDYKLNLSKLGSVKSSPLINPFLMSYSKNNGFSYRQSFKYNLLLSGDRLLRVVPKMGYNFTRKEFYWSVHSEFNYWPEKIAAVHIDFGNGNRIYSSDVLDDLKALPDSTFNFDKVQLDYFYDLYFNFRHSIEIVNGLDLSVGFSTHRRKAVHPMKWGDLEQQPDAPSTMPDNIRNTYLSFAPRIRLEWTPCLYYYMNGHRKVNLRSKYPTFAVDWERGIKGVFGSTGQYERWEFDLQHHIPLGLLRNIYYRVGFGAFTNQKEMYFVDFANFARSNLPEGWNDEIGGVFQLLDGRWYNSSRQYIRANFTYEAPFLLLRHLMKYTRYVQNERIYVGVLSVPHLQPYIELGYGIGTHIFDFGVFVGSENWKYTQVGCKFTFELFNR